MNLPWTMRFRQENVLLIGLIPGPTEPKTDINPFLAPLVQELQRLFLGVEMYLSPCRGVYLFYVHYFVLHVMYQHQERCMKSWGILQFMYVQNV